jgi:prolyl 4-hydroxylase
MYDCLFLVWTLTLFFFIDNCYHLPSTANKDMKQNCAPACKSCDALLFENRCPLDPNAVNAWLAGDLDRTFARIANSKVLNSSIPYDVEVLSAPFMTGDPWVIVLDNFLTREETDHLVSLGEMEGFEQSYEVSTELNPDGSFKEYLSDYRTSSTSWCKQESGCYGNATVQHVLDRISGLLQIPTKNAEAIQFLKYTKGQVSNFLSFFIWNHIFLSIKC